MIGTRPIGVAPIGVLGATSAELIPSVGLVRAIGNTPTPELAWHPITGLVRMLGNVPELDEIFPFVGLVRMLGNTATITEGVGGRWHKEGLATGTWGNSGLSTGTWGRAPTGFGS